MAEAGFYPSRRLKKRGNEYFVYLNLWPFAGVMFFLLFIFLALTQPHYHRPISGDLPTVDNPKPLPWANREDAMRLNVTRDGTLFFQGIKIRPMDLSAKIRAAVASGSEPRVYLYVDGWAKHGDVKATLDYVRSAAIENVSFVAYKKRS